MTFLQFAVGIPSALLLLYVAARVVSAAVFRSKHDHETMRKGIR